MSKGEGKRVYDYVAPFAGAWIEIEIESFEAAATIVAPFAGAWIEILALNMIWHSSISRSLRGSVD